MMANASRSVKAIAAGTRAEMLAEIDQLANELDSPVTVGDDGIGRLYVRTREPGFPTVEQFYVACPAVVLDKQHDRFEDWWTAHTAPAAAA